MVYNTPSQKKGGGLHKKAELKYKKRGGQSAPPPNDTYQKITKGMLIVQKLHVVVSMLSKVSYGQVGGSFPPEANVITLMGLTGHYWSSYCPVLVYY